MFRDRQEAGLLLSEKLKHYQGKEVIVLAVPRGGVVVAGQIAKELNCPLHLIIPRKIGAPQNPEYALGAVTLDGSIVLNPSTSPEILEEEKFKKYVEKEIAEIKRRLKKYEGENKVAPDLKDKIVILVDDGIATGSTMLAAILSAKKQSPKKIVVVVAVLPRETLYKLQRKVDEVVYLEAPEVFYAVGQFYQDFSQSTDEEVIEILEKFNGKK